MRALQVEQFGDPLDTLKVSEVDERAPGSSEIKVRVAGVGAGYFDGLLKRISIIGVNWGGEVMENPAVVPPVVQQLVDWTLAGELKAEPDHVYSLEQVGEAFSALFERRSAGKIMIRP